MHIGGALCKYVNTCTAKHLYNFSVYHKKLFCTAAGPTTPPASCPPTAHKTVPRARRTVMHRVQMSRVCVGSVTTNTAANLTLEPAFLEAKADTLIDQGVKNHPEWIQGLINHLQTRVHPFTSKLVKILDGCDTSQSANARAL